MSDMDPEVRALLDAARSARPGAAARARMDAALAAQLGVPLGAPPPAAPPPAAPILSGALAKLITVGVLVGAAGAGVVALRAPAERAVAPVATSSAAPPMSASALPVVAPPAPEVIDPAPSAEPPPRPLRRPKLAPPPAAGTLDEEVALLRDAQRALREGDGAQALGHLDALAARHPDGVLREERLAARVLALCAAGRVDEAREAGQRFVAEMPGSVQADRVRGSCAFARAR
jgi:hypothetical protein